MKYRKKPVVIEAIRLEDSDSSICGALMFVHQWKLLPDWIGAQETIQGIRRTKGMYINTLEGNMHASFGDYIIKGIRGEFYPCKPDIFEASYELAE